MEELTPYQKLCLVVGELLVHVGLMGTISDQWPQDLQDRWAERVSIITEDIDQEVQNIQNFGESFDETQ